MNHIVLLPVFVQITLTFVLALWMGGARFLAVRSRAVRPKDIVLGQPAWPARVTQIDRAYHNQLELPLVFYALAAFVLVSGVATATFVWMEWVFVALRLVHAFIHVTSNHLLARFLAFASGVFVLLAMWIWFAARLYGAI